ncbi:TolC family protein [Porphyromonas gingivicanis]|uniref:TolC family protein n=1 Tax=Porphyromonas gingivicanis TaxID=266762 RepID=UPI00046F628D|nr:TolC family protein [Porphyromonas gingivicanis]
MTKNRLLLFLGLVLVLWGTVSVPNYAQVVPDNTTIPTNSPPHSREISLDEAIEIALAESSSVQVGELLIQKQKYSYREALGQLFPSVNLSGNYSYTIKKQVMYLDGFPGASSMPEEMLAKGIEVGRTNNIQGGVNVALPLVNAQLWRSITMSKENLALAMEQANTTKVNKVAEIRKAFLQTLLARDAYEVLLASYRNALNNYRLVESNYKQGLVAQYDLFRSEVQVKNLEPNLRQAQDAANTANSSLLVLMGLPPHFAIVPKGTLKDYAPEIIDKYIVAEHSTLDNNPTLKELAHQKKLLNSSLELSKASFIPTLSVSGMYNFSFSSNKLDLDNSRLWTPFSSINFNLSIPIFSGGKRYYNVQQQKVALLQFELNRRDIERQLTIAQKDALDRVRRAVQTYTVSQEAIKLAEKGYSIATKRFETGEGTLLEVNDADVALLQARLNYHQSLFDFMVAQSELEKLEGKGLPDKK